MEKILKIYRYLFYKYARWDIYSWKHGNIDSSRHTGLCILSLLIGLNFFNLLIVIQFLAHKNIIIFEEFMKLKMLCIGGVFLILNYYFLARRKKYIQIFKEFEKEDKKTSARGSVIAWSYYILTFVFLWGTAFLLGHFNRAEIKYGAVMSSAEGFQHANEKDVYNFLSESATQKRTEDDGKLILQKQAGVAGMERSKIQDRS